MAAQDLALHYQETKILRTETGSNAESVNNLMRLWHTAYQHSQYWIKNSTQRDVIVCVLNYALTYARKQE